MPSNNKPFMNNDNAAKKKTLIDVSVKSNAVGMFSSIQEDGGDFRRNVCRRIYTRPLTC